MNAHGYERPFCLHPSTPEESVALTTRGRSPGSTSSFRHAFPCLHSGRAGGRPCIQLRGQLRFTDSLLHLDRYLRIVQTHVLNFFHFIMDGVVGGSVCLHTYRNKTGCLCPKPLCEHPQSFRTQAPRIELSSLLTLVVVRINSYTPPSLGHMLLPT